MRPYLVIACLSISACAVPKAEKPDYSIATARRVGSEMLVLQNGRFNCPEGYHRGFYFQPQGGWSNCWTTKDDKIIIEFEDGDKREIIDANKHKFVAGEDGKLASGS